MTMDAATMDVATIDVETTDAATTAGGGTMQRATDADDAKAQKGSGIRRQGWGTKKNNRRRSRNIGDGGWGIPYPDPLPYCPPACLHTSCPTL